MTEKRRNLAIRINLRPRRAPFIGYDPKALPIQTIRKNRPFSPIVALSRAIVPKRVLLWNLGNMGKSFGPRWAGN
jgi:hypothetical protein